MNKNGTAGFTLIELMITVAIVGILAAIAYPSYTDYLVKGRRADAMQALINAASAIERYKAGNNFTYQGACGSKDDGCTNKIFTGNVPADGGTVFHEIKVSVDADFRGYTLTATPKGSLIGKDGALTLNHRGEKTWTEKNGTTKHSCWPKGGNSC